MYSLAHPCYSNGGYQSVSEICLINILPTKIVNQFVRGYMPDISALSALISSFSAAQSIAKGFLELKTLADVQSKVIELQSVILSAQTSALAAQAEHASLAKNVEELERELTSLREWERERSRYSLKQFDCGVFVYELSPSDSRGEPIHWLCSNCFSQGHKSILQYQGDFYGSEQHSCPRCKTDISISAKRRPPQPIT